MDRIVRLDFSVWWHEDTGWTNTSEYVRVVDFETDPADTEIRHRFHLELFKDCDAELVARGRASVALHHMFRVVDELTSF